MYRGMRVTYIIIGDEIVDMFYAYMHDISVTCISILNTILNYSCDIWNELTALNYTVPHREYSSYVLHIVIMNSM